MGRRDSGLVVEGGGGGVKMLDLETLNYCSYLSFYVVE